MNRVTLQLEMGKSLKLELSIFLHPCTIAYSPLAKPIRCLFIVAISKKPEPLILNPCLFCNFCREKFPTRAAVCSFLLMYTASRVEISN